MKSYIKLYSAGHQQC